VVDSHSARIGLVNEDCIPIQANHRDICRFSHRDHSEYRIISRKLEELKNMAIHTVIGPVRDYKNRIAGSSKYFVGRDQELEQLNTFLCDTPRIPRQAQMVDIHGLGGQGKTQLALRYIQLYGYKFEPIFWIDGTNTESIQKSYAKIASVLGYPQVGAMLTARDDVHRFLNARSNPWLFV
jgi:hypothetical protein